MTDFPILDAPRTADVGREVIRDIGHIEPRIDETDEWVTMPIRLVTSQGVGIYLELGPYDLNARDIATLVDAIGAYYRNVGDHE